MEKFIAKLTGEFDKHTNAREFDDVARAIAWLQAEGLSEFPDQPARGEVRTGGGSLVWARSHLRMRAQTESDQGGIVRYVLAKLT
jgi:hypothetical protein